MTSNNLKSRAPVVSQRLWDSAEVAEYLQVPTGTLDQWASRGGGPKFSKIGKHRRYRQRDVEAFVDAMRHE